MEEKSARYKAFILNLHEQLDSSVVGSLEEQLSSIGERRAHAEKHAVRLQGPYQLQAELFSIRHASCLKARA